MYFLVATTTPLFSDNVFFVSDQDRDRLLRAIFPRSVCGLQVNRDVNAATNILALGMQGLALA